MYYIHMQIFIIEPMKTVFDLLLPDNTHYYLHTRTIL